jgi:hypothetical protein
MTVQLQPWGVQGGLGSEVWKLGGVLWASHVPDYEQRTPATPSPNHPVT